MTKCIDCNAPVVRTVDGEFVCVDCGSSPIETGSERAETASARLEVPH